jgi:muconolactone delta-isomerase
VVDEFMVVCTFRAGTDMREVFAVVAEEQAAVATLSAQGRVGDIRLSLARGTVFIQVFGADAGEATASVRSLPMARWWDIDAFPIAAPAAGGAS